ncbi:MAG: hypothetical protein R2712_25740 [Vicinamibacterales bacterium]
MKAASSRSSARAQARSRVASVRSLREEAPFAEDRFLGPQLPFMLSPYRLQAADRWWQENAPAPEVPRKRVS